MDAGGTLVGRDDECAALSALLCGAGEHHHAFVIGEAGIGKTRLVAAATARATAEGVLVLVGACLPLSESLPLLPFGDVLRAAADADRSAFEAALAACPQFVSEAVDRVVSASPVAAERPTLLGARQQTFVAIRLLLSAFSRHRRVAIVIEDVHWADASTVDLLEYLLAPTQHTGVPIVMTFRDHPLAERDTAGAALRDEAMRHVGVLRLALGVLGPDAVDAQITALTGSPPDPALAASIYSRSQGNPFFVDQLVAHLSGGEAVASMPPGLATLLLNRLAGLDADAEAIVAALAVAARPLPGAELAQVCAMSLGDVLSGLRSLERRGLLRPHPDGYDLRHQLLAQAVSTDLLDEPRRDLHRAVGDVLAGRSGELFAAEAAEHYERAGVAEDELHARVRAARYAQQVFAWPNAERHWRRALTCYGPVVPRPDDHTLAWEIYFGLHQALWARGAAEVHDLDRAAYDQLHAVSQPRQRAELALNLGYGLDKTAPERALACFDRALSDCDGSGPSRLVLDSLLAKAKVLERAGRADEAAAILDTALHVATASGDTESLDLVEATAAVSDVWRGDVTASRRRAAQLIERVAVAPGWYASCYLGASAVAVLLKLGDLPAAHDAGRIPLALIDERGIGDNMTAWVLRWYLVEAQTELGLVSDAATVLAGLPDRRPDVVHRRGHAASAHVAMLRGDQDRARARWTALDSVTFAEIDFRVQCAQRRIEFDLWDGNPDAALRRAHDVLAAARDNDESAGTGPVLLLAMRSCDGVADGPERAAELVRLRAAMTIDPLTAGPMRPTADAVALQWTAELARVAGTDKPEAWAAAAAAWEGHGRPHRAAFALWREAECLLRVRGRTREAQGVLARAAVASDQHVPLHTAITDLARRARIELRRPSVSPPEPAAASSPFGLTARERAVLALVAEGKSNAEIGTQLYMSPKTASVHVSAILRKLGVATRAHAAAVAERAGLLERS